MPGRKLYWFEGAFKSVCDCEIWAEKVKSFHEKAGECQGFSLIFLFFLSFSLFLLFPNCFPLSQAASVATLPSALFVERWSLGASWVYARTLPEYVLALKGLGVERYHSYLADGHSEYFGRGGHRVVSPPVHEVLPVAETGQRETFLQHPAPARAAPDDLLRDVQGSGAER